MKKPKSINVKFIADECVGEKTIKFLRALGYEVNSVWDLNLKGAPDEKLIQRAIKDKRIFITEDQNFTNIILYPPHLHRGIIVLKISLKIQKEVWFVLKELLFEFKSSDFEKTLIIVDKNRFRIRR